MFDGPYKGRKHGSEMLADSELLTKLNNISLISTTTQSVYLVTLHTLEIYRNLFKNTAPGLTPELSNHNKVINQVWQSVEWVFGDILIFFAFLDFKKKLKINLLGKI